MTRRLPFFLGKILPFLETILGLPLSWVSHISLDPDPLAATPIVDHKFSALFIPFANGISISPSGSEVAVASTSLSQVLIYSRDAVSNGLKHIHTVPVPFCADNLMFDETGDLIVAGHPSFIKVIKVAADKTNEILSPSWIVAIKPHTYELETLFLSNGSTFSSSSTALRDLDGALYVTGLYAEGVMVCRP
jgi:sugar lactone lactonase YvrE